MEAIRRAIESFVGSSQQPALTEPGEDMIQLSGDNLSLDERAGCVLLQAWDDHRNLCRRVVGIESRTRAKLVLRIERFGKKAGALTLVDLKRTDPQTEGLRTARLEFREVFRRFLRRDFSAYKIAELSTEADLEDSLSPGYPRALLRQGSSAIAAIAAAPNAAPVSSALSFGLIWLDYLRRREPGMVIRTLLLFLPAGQEKATCLRIPYLDPSAVSCSIFCYTEDGYARPVDLSDAGNVDTRLEPFRRGSIAVSASWQARVAAIEGVEAIDTGAGGISYRVRGLEFARTIDEEVRWGLETKRSGTASNGGEIEALARELVRVRSPEALDRRHPLYLRNPESWLEAVVRSQLEALDPTLCGSPIYGQVPAFAGGERGVLDLLAVDRAGRLAVIELKTSQDIHLPLQGLDYWLRVKWHLDRNEFSGKGYFPGTELQGTPPRLLLVAPALDFHPTNERVARFFSPVVRVERFGVGLDWQKQLKLMYRM